jgi:AcrR family transcriptional regulator
MSQAPASYKTAKSKRARGELTRDALVIAALEIFGRDGYHAASTRDIAELANANQALINYHFKGKQGLYLAVFEHIATQMTSGMGNIATEILGSLDSIQTLPQDQKTEFAISSLERITSRLLHMMNSKLTQHWSNMILREQQHPTAAFDIMHKGPMGRLFSLSTRLIALAKNIEPDSEQAKLLSILLFGQVHILKISRASVLSHMQWKEFGEKEMAIAEQQIFLNLRALLKPDA